jgi:hypothetical protein
MSCIARAEAASSRATHASKAQEVSEARPAAKSHLEPQADAEAPATRLQYVSVYSLCIRTHTPTGLAGSVDPAG